MRNPFASIFKRKVTDPVVLKEQPEFASHGKDARAFLPTYSSGNYRQFAVTFNGEKSLGEIGPVKHYFPDYHALRARSWQAYLDNDVAQTILKKFTKWVVGSGLKLQAEPAKVVLQSEGVQLDVESFNEITEARFALFSKNKDVDYAGQRTLHQLASEAFMNKIIGGDILVIMRLNDELEITIQLVDGAHLCSPVYGDDRLAQIVKNGNRIVNGVELSPKGEHVAYWVRRMNLEAGYTTATDFHVERIPARDPESGLVRSFLVYGLKYRLDNYRGLPLISALLETLKKLERYKEATLGSAEERQKIAYFIEHLLGSTGENPMANNLVKAFSTNPRVDDIPVDVQNLEKANTIAVTTGKQVFNLPINSTIKQMDGKTELYFKDFFQVLVNLICAAVNMPPDVAMSKYDSNFSASRAALKDWEHTLTVERSDFASAFYQHVYNFFLDLEILKNKIQAPGYLVARQQKNKTVLMAYRNARFVGAAVPHIDPLKEVNAERMKLGNLATSIPLTTVEAATEALNSGESDQNIAQFAEELEEAKRLGLTAPEPPKNKPTKNQ